MGKVISFVFVHQTLTFRIHTTDLLNSVKLPSVGFKSFGKAHEQHKLHLDMHINYTYCKPRAFSSAHIHSWPINYVKVKNTCMLHGAAVCVALLDAHAAGGVMNWPHDLLELHNA